MAQRGPLRLRWLQAAGNALPVAGRRMGARGEQRLWARVQTEWRSRSRSARKLSLACSSKQVRRRRYPTLGGSVAGQPPGLASSRAGRLSVAERWLLL